MDKAIIVSISPHIHDETNVNNIMWKVVVALMPALLAGIYYFGLNALLLSLYGIFAAVATEYLMLLIRKKPIRMMWDGSAVITGLLVSFNVHSGVPWWIPVIGSIFAIAIGKHCFGGLGHNIVNPALLGRAFLVLSWPTYMTSNWVRTSMDSMNGMTKIVTETLPDMITSATPLGLAKMLREDPELIRAIGENPADLFSRLTAEYSTLFNLFWGNIGGCIGEVSAAAILLGGLYLLWKNIIEWRIPFFYIATVFVLTWIFGQGERASIMVPFFHILSGGLMLGAFFMATDMVTSPITKKGRIIFAIGCGVLTAVIRLYGGFPEGVCFSILIMNLLVPLIDKYTFPKPFGSVRRAK
jgi:electron transport complex protein RnfD